MYTYMYMHVYVCTFLYTHISTCMYIRKFDFKKEAMLLKDGKERYVSGF